MTRGELEALIRPTLAETVTALERALRSAGPRPPPTSTTCCWWAGRRASRSCPSSCRRPAWAARWRSTPTPSTPSPSAPPSWPPAPVAPCAPSGRSRPRPGAPTPRRRGPPPPPSAAPAPPAPPRLLRRRLPPPGAPTASLAPPGPPGPRRPRPPRARRRSRRPRGRARPPVPRAAPPPPPGPAATTGRSAPPPPAGSRHRPRAPRRPIPSFAEAASPAPPAGGYRAADAAPAGPVGRAAAGLPDRRRQGEAAAVRPAPQARLIDRARGPLLIVAVVATLALTAKGEREDRPVADIEVGECFTGDDQRPRRRRLRRAAPAELFVVVAAPDPPAALPGRRHRADRRRRRPAAPRSSLTTGRRPTSPPPNGLELQPIAPTEEQWDDGATDTYCLADPDGGGSATGLDRGQGRRPDVGSAEEDLGHLVDRGVDQLELGRWRPPAAPARSRRARSATIDPNAPSWHGVDGGDAEAGGQDPVERGRRAAPLDVAEHDGPGLVAGALLDRPWPACRRCRPAARGRTCRSRPTPPTTSPRPATAPSATTTIEA